MKSLYFIAVLFALPISQAQACPNLAGNYQCESVDENGSAYTYVNSVTQSTAKGVTTYTSTVEGEVSSVVADGKERVEYSQEDGYFTRLGFTGQCKGQKLVISAAFVGAYDSNFKDVFIEGTNIATVQLTANGIVSEVVEDQTFTDENGDKQKFNDVTIENCTRL